MKKLILYLWQLPQNLIGLIFLLYFKMTSLIMVKENYKYASVYLTDNMSGGITLGKYIFLRKTTRDQEIDIHHEYGHCRQSMMLGWLFVFVIGLPSLIHAWLYRYDYLNPNGYYEFWTEWWADRLGGVDRK